MERDGALWHVHCLEAVYDEDGEMLVLNCFVKDIGEKRIFIMNRADWHFKSPGTPVPHREMHRTAAMLCNKHLNIEMHSDPQREQIPLEQQMQYAATFNKRISKELEQVSEGLASDDRITQRKLENLLGKARVERLKTFGIAQG